MFYVYRLRSVSCLRNCTYINRNLFGTNLTVNTTHNFHFRTHNTTSDNNIENMAAKMAKPSSSTSVTHTNRLAQEKSPYLLQHANNPVDWYPWCDEAIQKAKQENKLIFLSVGYSTCHWCHVMEKESFEDEEVAKLMNENYINIKVDREERPDIDKIYMMFVLMINGSGGWPMSVWLTPDLAPLTAGTYFPPNDRWGMPGFKSILSKIALKWKDNGPELTRTGQTVIQALKKNANEKNSENDNTLTVEGKFNQCISIYKRNFDSEWGGFGRSPKFPEVSKLNLLLHAHFKQPKGKIAEIVLTTITKIANGGIHDHVFGGFARYSVDQKWHVPHFEKMLYDQGQLLVVYSNAYRLTGNQFYLDICDKLIKYICKDLKHPGGGFYSGEDADSLPEHSDTVKVEGAFYAWNYAEVEDAIKSNEKKFTITEDVDCFEIYSYHYDIQQDGNVEPSSDPQGHLLGKNILFVNGSVKDTANKFKTNVDTVNHILKIGNEILYDIRCKRPRPHLDTKIICAWNGLMLSGLAKVSCIASSPKQKEYLGIAKQLVEFLKVNLYNSETKSLLRSCYGEGIDSDVASNGSDPIPGFLDDYAFLIKGLLDYYVATQDVSILHWAVDLQKTQDELFWDTENGAYFYSQADSPNVIVRLKEDHDGAEPCGNSMSVHNLMYLNTYFEDHRYKDKAKEILDFFENSSPFGYVLPHMMSGLLLFDSGLELLVVVGSDNDDSKKLLECVKNYFIPGLVPIQIKVDHPEQLTRKSALLFKMVKNLPTAYICHNQVCQLPVTKPEELSESLAERYLYKCDTN